MISDIKLDNEYCSKKPFPHYFQDDILEQNFAKKIQEEILILDNKEWDRYENPFEQKYTLRDKYNFPENLKKLFEILSSSEFIDTLSKKLNVKLFEDKTRNFWGVHKYKNGDKLDIHVDAGYHPSINLKKEVTLGIYLSSDWKEEYGCHLEIWKGDNCTDVKPVLHEKIASIAPMFNRLVLFTNDDYSWHGNPDPVSFDNINSKRIFITLSYLSEEFHRKNKRVKAFFIKTPDEEENEEKDRLRELRADAEKYKEVYRYNSNSMM